MNQPEFQAAVSALPFGKTFPTARYLYAPDESVMPEPVSSFVGKFRRRLALDASFNMIKTLRRSLIPRLSPGTLSAYACHQNPASPPGGYRGAQGLGERTARALEQSA